MTFATTNTAGETSATGTFSRPVNSTGCRTAPQLQELSPAELDAHVVSLGHLMAKAHRLGDRAGAVELQRLMYEAIALRTPGHQEAMERSIHQRMQDACYFSSDAAHSLTGGAR